MTPAARHVLLGAPFDPYRLGNNAAAYSLAGAASDSTYKIDGSNRLYYVADRSGNSAVNGLVLPGVASNTATTATKSLTGNQTITVDWAAVDYTPSANHTIFSKLSGNDGIEALMLTTGVLRLRIGDGASVTNVDSTVSVATSNFARATFALIWEDGVGATFTVNGAALGTAVAAVKTLTNAATTATIGTSVVGVIYRVQVGSSYDFNPTLAAKLATSVTDGVSGTWTVGQTAIALPARIHGARDLYQGLTASMPTFSVSGGYNIATGDGTANFLKSADFAGSTSASVYLTGSGVSWTDLDCLADFTQGANTGLLQIRQNTTTPNIGFINSGGTQANTAELALGVRGVISVVNTAGGVNSIRINQLAAKAGVAVSNTFGGVTLFARWATSTADRFANGTFSALLVRSVADNASNELRINRYFMRQGGIAG